MGQLAAGEVSSRASRRGRKSPGLPGWWEIAPRFTEPVECLASFLALEAAEVIAGEKPANLISIVNRLRPCGRNPYGLWKQWGATVLAGSGLSVRELADRGDAILLLIYRRDALADLMARPAVRALLSRAGYGNPPGVNELLTTLSSRIAGGSFPHEIGIFLGYPLKDVAGFMGIAPIPFACQGPWKIFGNPGESLRLAERFRCCRIAMGEWLTRCPSARDCLKQGHFFPHKMKMNIDIKVDSAC